jgi:hypothetical protein
MVHMPRVSVVAGAVLCAVVAAHAIGQQHGLFRSQSTQGEAWRGTATIVKEHYAITVYPDYLDVELDWVFEVGGTEPDSFANALEIVGNLNLADKSVVVGMITWYQDMILKGKLKTSDVAREQYEQVVERDSDAPPPPRDPVLLEWIRDDNYDISIFPVDFGGTRRVRIRYLIPAFTTSGVNRAEYPHAFTDNASVSIKKGPGVASYRIETGGTAEEFDNRVYRALSDVTYEFQAYGSGTGERISHIVPVLAGNTDGSIFYVGTFSTPSFGGQMLHVATMSGEEALRNTPMPEDFVILWRWNHPDVLARYARQIVGQSALLQEFLASLDAAGKRAALVIDKEGGERITFTLDSPGGAEYNRMIAYLEELSRLAVVDPPMRDTPRTGDIDFDIDKAFEEFREALQAAAALFERESAALKHLLILTAGPKLVSSYVADQTVNWDQDINVSLFTSYFRSSKAAADLGSVANQTYWPGVRLDRFVQDNGVTLAAYATVGNGVDTNTIDVLPLIESASSSCRSTTTEMHLYTDRPIEEQIRWSIRSADAVIAEYTEVPRIVVMDDGMQYGRLIGSSPHLTPLARRMPSSMASTLGFIDEKYSLVALEEDALPVFQAKRYERSGVPLLDQADIFPDPDERPDVPVAEWLAANPPESMARQVCAWRDELVVRVAMDAVFMDFAAVPMAVNAVDVEGGPALLGMPFAGDIYYEPADPEAYIDYESALSAASIPLPEPASASTVTGVACFVKDGCLVIDLGALSPGLRQQLTLVLSDLSGRIVREWSGAQFASQARLSVPLAESGLCRGTYLLRIRGAGVSMDKRVVVW